MAYHSGLSELTPYGRLREGLAIICDEKDSSMLREIPRKLKRLFNKKLKAQYKLNWIDNDLELTRDGQDEFINWLYEENKDKFGTYAEKILAEREAKEE